MLPPQFLSHPPSFPPATELDRVMEALTAQSPSIPDYLVVVDAQQRPLGMMSVAKLWAFYHHLPPAPQSSAPPLLQDWQPYWEPVLAIPAQISPADLGTYLQAQPQGHWVTVDSTGGYRAYIEARGLLAWLLPQLGLRPQTQEPEGLLPPPLTPQEQDWLMALSHSLKTPLTSLLGLSSLLLDPRVGALSDRQTRYATLMRRAIRQLIRMVNEWVDWLRLESGDLVLDWQELDLASLLTDLLPQFLNSRLPGQPPPAWAEDFTLENQTCLASLGGDRQRLGQALHSCLDYLLQQQSQPLGLTLTRWDSWLSLHLRGTYPKDQPYPDLIAPGGTALDDLGLSLARQLCRAHGGDLGGFCSPQLGYHLTLLIPLPQEARTTGPVVVMLVSRAITVIDAIYSQLQGGGYGLVVVTNPTEVSRVADRLTPRVVIWDGESFSPALAPPANLGGELLQLTETDPSPGLAAATLARGDLSLALLPTLASMLEGGITVQPPTLLLLHGVAQAPALSPEWHQTLQNHQCCLLQAEDIDQAKLLCRIWQPDAIVLDQQAPPRAEDLMRIGHQPDLAARPLVLLGASPEGAPNHLKLVDAGAVMDRSPDQGAMILLRQINLYRSNRPLS